MPASTIPDTLAPTSQRPDPARTVLIASEDLVARWSEATSEPTGLIAIADTDATHALEIIRRHDVQLVILEQIFAASARGQALVRDLRSSPRLDDLEIRMLREDRAALVARTATKQALTSMSSLLGRQPSRRARRLKMRLGTTAILNGAPVEIVELLTSGIQVVSSRIVKPHQAVRVVIRREDEAQRADGTVIWSRAELTQDRLCYHAGIAFDEDRPELLATVLSEVEA